MLLDVVMPGMTGIEVFRVIRKFDPQAKVILFSGQPFAQPYRELLDEGLRGFIKKPFDLDDRSSLLAAQLHQR